MFNFDITKGRSGISALLASLAIVISGATFSGAVLAQPGPTHLIVISRAAYSKCIHAV